MKILIIYLVIISTSLFASTKGQIVFHEKSFQQGSIQETNIFLDESFVQKFEIQKLTRKIIGESLYFHEIGPLLKTADSPNYKVKAQVVFVKIPKTNSVKHKVGNEEIDFSWDTVEITPIEAGQSFIFEDFEISKRFKAYYWFIVFLIGIPLGYFLFKLYENLKLKKKIKEEKSAVLTRLLSANHYEDIVEIWKNKIIISKTYPGFNEMFKDVEKVLFLYGFKPSQTQNEKDQVVKAYQEMIAKFQGSLRGI